MLRFVLTSVRLCGDSVTFFFPAFFSKTIIFIIDSVQPNRQKKRFSACKSIQPGIALLLFFADKCFDLCMGMELT